MTVNSPLLLITLLLCAMPLAIGGLVWVGQGTPRPRLNRYGAQTPLLGLVFCLSGAIFAVVLVYQLLALFEIYRTHAPVTGVVLQCTSQRHPGGGRSYLVTYAFTPTVGLSATQMLSLTQSTSRDAYALCVVGTPVTVWYAAQDPHLVVVEDNEANAINWVCGSALFTAAFLGGGSLFLRRGLQWLTPSP